MTALNIVATVENPPVLSKRAIANRLNAQKSTGPKTREGKDASRRNALKSGLTGRGVVLPEEVEADVAARFEAVLSGISPA